MEQTGALLRRLRMEHNMTQRQVAEQLCVSPQAVSKWEKGKGYPDVSMLPVLSALFGVAAERLVSGEMNPEDPDGGNMKRVKFYVCPDCGNILTATGGGELHCCGRRLEPLKAQTADESHGVTVQEVDDEWYITFPHPMEKQHYFRFAAYAATERLLLIRLYPEQGGELRMPHMRGGRLYFCCSRDGLFEIPL